MSDPATFETWKRVPTSTCVLGSLCLAGLIWASWPGLVDMNSRWSNDPRYSHGYLVPLFSAFLIWHRRAMLASVTWKSSWWGLGLVGVGVALKVAGSLYFVNYVEQVALLPLLAGLVALLGGGALLKATWPSIVFLVFMIPLPYRLESAIGGPLQFIATRISTYSLQTMGLPAFAEGTIIDVNSSKINVVEACNGLGMLMMFGAYAAGAVLVLNRPWYDKLVILLGAVPIAILANATRITVTGLLHTIASSKVADMVYHDLAGWLMMPLALVMLWLELKVLSMLFLEEEAPAKAVPITVVTDTRRPKPSRSPGR